MRLGLFSRLTLTTLAVQSTVDDCCQLATTFAREFFTADFSPSSFELVLFVLCSPLSDRRHLRGLLFRFGHDQNGNCLSGIGVILQDSRLCRQYGRSRHLTEFRTTSRVRLTWLRLRGRSSPLFEILTTEDAIGLARRSRCGVGDEFERGNQVAAHVPRGNLLTSFPAAPESCERLVPVKTLLTFFVTRDNLF